MQALGAVRAGATGQTFEHITGDYPVVLRHATYVICRPSCQGLTAYQPDIHPVAAAVNHRSQKYDLAASIPAEPTRSACSLLSHSVDLLPCNS